MARTAIEKSLLQKLSSGMLDGRVGDELTTAGRSTVWHEIRDGIPQQVKQGPGTKFFDGHENVRIEGERHVLQTWEDEDDQLAFLQKFGWLMGDDEAREYSA